jgi:hypothetical protein
MPASNLSVDYIKGILEAANSTCTGHELTCNPGTKDKSRHCFVHSDGKNIQICRSKTVVIKRGANSHFLSH